MASHKSVTNTSHSSNITDKVKESTCSTGPHVNSSRPNYRRAKMNTVMLVMNVVALIFAFWQPPFSYDMSPPSDACKRREKRAERILEAQRLTPMEETGLLFAEGDEDMYNYITLFSIYPTHNVDQGEAPQETEQTEQQNNTNNTDFNELYTRVSNNWNQTVQNMVNQYVAYTDGYFMDVTWRDEMWNRGWYVYLESIHADLNRFLNDETLSLEARECVSQDLLYWANDDFGWFLNLVKEEWDIELMKRSELLITEV
ncbi:Uncharacterized protein PCOAH_00003870 [Plasmodium coatneyi]|uniref:Uncharacterized protein n=1 Tax=Plasmodium coatneyi TaxID=208452 RepID=A0A1B1DSZ4_9APIC|nr:Uncharacterized protein PCOAH_00003870 [Plasmodium coatneyi]ANQ05911.1 Uncharacterized protein PCOAH_00003870 [Plasmodium coatneyi]